MAGAQGQEQANQARDKAASRTKPASPPGQQGKSGQQRVQQRPLQAEGQARNPKGKQCGPLPIGFTGQAGITTWTLQSITNAVPPTAGVVCGTLGQSAASTNDTIVVAADATGTGACYAASGTNSGSFDGWRTAGQFRLVLSTAQQVYWRSSSANSQFRFDINGYEF